MLTKNDLKAIKQIVQETAATKDDLDKLVSKNVFDQFKDRILTLLDKVLGELKAIREEQTIITGYKDQIENHDTRIDKLEEVLQP